MRFEIFTVYQVTKRLVDLSMRPLLFHDHMPPARVTVRLNRVVRWCGPALSMAVASYIGRRKVPERDNRRFGRSDGGRR